MQRKLWQKRAERNRQLAEATAAKRRERLAADARLRIARDLHDVITHHLSAISVQAGLAGYVFDSDPPTARSALNTVAKTTRETLEELRRLRAVLDPAPRGDSGVTASGLSGLETVADRVRGAGLSVEITTTGTPRPLPAGVELCAYRVIQEALANVLAHAGPCHATVLVQYHESWLRTRISDDGRGAQVPGGDGHGLTGMRERAKLYGGQLTAGPGPAGGFQVTLTVPLPGAER
jgi:signal transduction histidine kinase